MTRPTRHLGGSSIAGGYTLIELMVVMTIVGLLVAVAGPSFSDIISRNRHTSGMRDNLSMLALARGEAVSRAEPVTACASTDGATCNSSNWELGWLVFADHGQGGGGIASDGIINGSEAIVRIGDAVSGGLTIRSSNFAVNTHVTFTPVGMVGSRGTFTICNNKGATSAKAVVLNISGQARLGLDSTGSDYTVEDDSGAAATCPP